MRYLKQSIVLLLSTLFVFALVYTSMSSYTPVILIALIIISLVYAIFMKRRRKDKELFVGNHKEVFTIIIFVLLVVFLTGGIRSPIFFLTYFIFFGLAFIFEPVMIFFFLICLLGVFMPEALQDDIFGNILKLLSLFFLSGLAFFFGREYKRRELLQKKVKSTTTSIIHEAEDIITTKDRIEKLKKAEEIIEEARNLRKESK